MDKKEFKKLVAECIREVLVENLSDTQEDPIEETTGTSAVQGFYGKNWVDPDPERKRMKSIAAKSVGGEVTK